MRVGPPKSMKLKRTELLRDIRERLEERDPALAERLDRGHPAWLILQEAAWLVESLSERLDEYPWAVVQQLAHLFGAEVGPAQPAVGVVVAQASDTGALEMGPNMARWRFLTPQTEEHGLIEYSLVEDAVPVAPIGELSAYRLTAAELMQVEAEGGACHTWFGDATRSTAFDSESVVFELVASDPEAVLKHLEDAIERLPKERAADWLVLEASQVDDRVQLVARIDPSAALGVEGAAADGGEVAFRLGPLDDSTWTPPVRVSDDPRLPRWLRGTEPRPGVEPDERVVDGVPAGFPLSLLLHREARPIPTDVVEAIWQTLAHLNTRLSPLRPTSQRVLDAGAEAPPWVAAALRKEAWFELADRADLRLVHVALNGPARDRKVRLSWVCKKPDTRVRCFGIHPESGMLPKALDARFCWRMELPGPRGGRAVWVCTYEVDVPAEIDGLVSTFDGDAVGVMVNPMLVVNAPAVRDGRAVGIRRAVPESATLLFEDIVTREVVQQVVDQGLDPSVAALLQAMPLARFEIEGDEPILDFAGVEVDAATGGLLFNAPDAFGIGRPLRRGTTVRLAWYRRTMAEVGNVKPGSITLVEQAPSTRPRLSHPTNPLAFALGAGRETEESAVQRMFGPARGVPVTAADWEREVLRALGARARGWLVRVWGYAERTTVHHALWPLTGVGDHAEANALRDQIASAGPEVLLVVLGPKDRRIAEEDLAWARAAVDRVVADAARRMPTVRRAIVTGLWPLTLDGGDPSMPLPAFGMRGLSGRLSDPKGRSAEIPLTSLLLNACVVSVERD